MDFLKSKYILRNFPSLPTVSSLVKFIFGHHRRRVLNTYLSLLNGFPFAYKPSCKHQPVSFFMDLINPSS